MERGVGTLSLNVLFNLISEASMQIPQNSGEDREVFTDRTGNPICSVPKGISSGPNSPWYPRLAAMLLIGGYQGNLVSIGKMFIQVHKDLDHTQIATLSEVIENKIAELGIPKFIGVKDPEKLREKFELYKELERFLENLRNQYQQ